MNIRGKSQGRTAMHWRRLAGAAIVAALACGVPFVSGIAQEKAPHKIGLLVAITGPQAVGGGRERDGAQMAIQEINAAGGVNGQPLELIVEDNQTSAQVGVTRLNKLISEDEVSIIAGDVGSAAMAYSPIIQRDGVSFIFNGGTLAVTEQGNPWMFRTIASDRYVVSRMLQYITKELGKKRIALLTETSAYGDGASTMFEDHAKAKDYDFEIVAHENFSINDVDATPQVTKIKGANPDVLVVWGASGASAVAMRNARDIGLQAPMFGAAGMVQPGVIDAAGHGAEDLIAVAYGIVPGEDLTKVTAVTQRLRDFSKAFAVKHPDRQLTFWELMSYDAVYLAAESLRKAGSNDPKAVRDALESIQRFEGTLGKYSFTAENHDGVKEDSIVLMQYRNGKWMRLWPL